MLELLMTFFDHSGAHGSENNVPPHLRVQEFEAAESFICSLELSEGEKATSLLH